MSVLRSKDGRTIPPMQITSTIQRQISTLAEHIPGSAKRRAVMPPAPTSIPPGGSISIGYKPVPIIPAAP